MWHRSLHLLVTIRIRSLPQVHFIVLLSIDPAVKFLPLVFRHPPRIMLRIGDPVGLHFDLIFDDIQGWDFPVEILFHWSSPKLSSSIGSHELLGYSLTMTFLCSTPFSALNIRTSSTVSVSTV